MENKIMSHITKGLIIALIGIVIGVGGFMAHIDQESWFRWISTAITAIGIIWGCVYYAKQLDGNVTFGKVFGHGFKIAIIVTLISIVYVVLAITVLFPEMKEKALETARLEMEKSGKMSDDQITQGVEFTKKFFMVFVLSAVLFGTLITGAIASLIGAAVAKKNPVSQSQQFNV